MRGRLRAALAASFALASVQAQALPYRGFAPGFTPGLSNVGSKLALSGDCANSFSSISGTLVTCVDAYNGAYASGGVAKVSLTAAGGALGGCTVTTGTGLVCTGTNVASIAGGNPAANYIFITKAITTPSNTALLFQAELGSSGAYLYDYVSQNNRQAGISGAGNINSLSPSGPTETAICISASTSYISIAGGSATSETSSGPGAAQTLYLGNASAGSSPNGAAAGNPLYSVRVVSITGSCTASTAQTASTL